MPGKHPKPPAKVCLTDTWKIRGTAYSRGEGFTAGIGADGPSLGASADVTVTKTFDTVTARRCLTRTAGIRVDYNDSFEFEGGEIDSLRHMTVVTVTDPRLGTRTISLKAAKTQTFPNTDAPGWSMWQSVTVNEVSDRLAALDPEGAVVKASMQSAA